MRAKVVNFKLEKHPNADLLSIATIDGSGWQCVVNTEQFAGVTKGIYVSLDSLVDISVPEFSFLATKAKDGKFRIKTIRLRGALSQGLLLPAPEESHIDDDFTEILKVERYEPPIPVHMGGDQISCPSVFAKYSSAHNVKNYPNLIEPGENVRVTCKIHGSNIRFGFVHLENGFVFMGGTHNTAKDLDGDNVYSRNIKALDAESKLKPLFEKYGPKMNMIVYGEIYGQSIQFLTYDSQVGQKIRIFDVLIDGKYQSWDVVQEFAQVLGIDTVPLLYHGPYDRDSIKKMLSEVDPIESGNKNSLREGVVVTPDIERSTHSLSRVSLKFINDEYLLAMGKYGTDGH